MRTILTIALLTFAGLAYANGCGFLPFPPSGCQNMCICDAQGRNCHVVTTCGYR